MRYRLDGQTKRWTENQLRGWALRVVKVTKNQHKVPREVGEISILGGIQKLSEYDPRKPIVGGPA